MVGFFNKNWVCAFFLAVGLSSNVWAQPSPVWSLSQVFSPSSGTFSPQRTVAVGNWNSDIVPDIALIPRMLGQSPEFHFVNSSGNNLASQTGPLFTGTVVNAAPGLERLIEIDVGVNGPDGLMDLLAVSGGGSVSFARNLGSQLDRAAKFSGAQSVGEISQWFPQLDITGSDRYLLFPIALTTALADGDNFQDLILAGVATNLTTETESTGLIVLRGGPNGFSTNPVSVPIVDFPVDAHFVDLDPSIPGAETLAVLEEVPPPPGWLGSIQYGYQMSFFRWDASIQNFVLQGQGHPSGPRHILTGYITGRVQSFDAADLNGDGRLDFVFASNTMTWGQPLYRGDVVILWGIPNSQRLEMMPSQTLMDISGGQNLSAYASVRVANVTSSPGKEIIVLQERVGYQSTPFSSAQILVFESGSSGLWADYPIVSDSGVIFFRRNSTGQLPSWTPTMASGDSLKFVNLNCDQYPEIVLAGAYVSPSPGVMTNAVAILKNESPLEVGDAQCGDREQGTPLAVAPLFPWMSATQAPAPRIALTSAHPRINSNVFNIRVSGLNPGALVSIAIGSPLPTIQIPQYGINLYVAPDASSNLMFASAALGDPARSARVEYLGNIPNDPLLMGLNYTLEGFFYDPTAGHFGNTQALDLTVGN